jgi:hypothetical protein
MLRRRPFALPYEAEVGSLVPLLDPSGGRLSRPPDLGRLLSAAAHHNVLGFVHRAMESGRLEAPAPTARRVADTVARAAVHSALLRRQLPAVASALAQAGGAPAVIVKGPAIGDRYYAEPALRPYADLDVMVPRAALGAAVAALGERGFEPLLEFRDGYAERHGHDIHMRARVGSRPIDVELHWRIGDDAATECLDHGFAAAGAEPLEAAGAGVLVPSAPRLLLLAAAHLLSDRAKRLAWIHDLQLISCACSAAGWEDAFAQADARGLGWVLHRALDYAEHHLGFRRSRPRPPGAPPAFGPLRAVEELDVRAAPHVGRLAALSWTQRPSYLRAVLLPTVDGLRGTAGPDAPVWKLAVRHARRMATGLAPRRK